MADKNLATTSQQYGPRDAEEGLPRAVRSAGATKSIVVDFDYTKLGLLSTSKPTTFWGASTPYNNVARIPAGSKILGVSLTVKAALSGNSSVLQVGLYDASGSAVDADGLIKDLSEASTDADGDKVYYHPALASVASVSPLMGTVASKSNDQFIAIYQSAASKSFTAGRARLTVEYEPPRS